MFEKFISAVRGMNPQTNVVDINGKAVTDENISELKKSELIDYISLLEKDGVLQKDVLNSLDYLKKSFSQDLYDNAETTTLTKIRDIDDAIVKAKKELNKLKETFADAIVFNNKSEILFLRRKNDSKFAPGVLGLPGGHIDPGEDAETAAKRELVEETNLESSKCTLLGELKNKDVEISYFIIEVKDKDLVILDASEHGNLEWKNLDDLDADDSIPGLKEKLEEFLNPTRHAVKVLKKAFEQDLISEDRYLEALSKAGGVAQIGEVREWSGQKMRKEAGGWVPVKGDKSGKKEDSDKKVNGPEGKEVDKKYSKEEVDTHARSASEEGLVKTSKGTDEKLRIAANKELERRGSEEKPQEEKKEKVSGGVDKKEKKEVKVGKKSDDGEKEFEEDNKKDHEKKKDLFSSKKVIVYRSEMEGGNFNRTGKDLGFKYYSLSKEKAETYGDPKQFIFNEKNEEVKIFRGSLYEKFNKDVNIESKGVIDSLKKEGYIAAIVKGNELVDFNSKKISAAEKEEKK